ncbi:phytanoyl-CoA dioxygenase family protein [Flavobacterium sp. ST-75]|uniref:Phytanoyl-CoA dioxygenase family protein n=1 Tax=Flavobacterium rhizophilum TaxID=3163296 RepID=A0ABW8Y9V1_9FLAO
MNFSQYKSEINNEGFAVIDAIYSQDEIDRIIKIIDSAHSDSATFRRSKDLFAIRQFLKVVPNVTELVFNQKLKDIVNTVFGEDYFPIKSIYFDKPGNSNWFVAYHQDLTISVNQKAEIENYGPWTVKQNQFAVQPPVEVLENIFTIRIHLDDTDENNGALKVIPKSHLKKIYRPETIDWNTETEATCNVPKGGVMIMKPLLLHSSARTVNNSNRRVIHIEFSNLQLPTQIKWAEKQTIN